MNNYTPTEQTMLNKARELLKGKALVDKYTERRLSQNEKLLFCIKHMEQHEEIQKILSGTHPKYTAVDKDGWRNGHSTFVIY
jgi:hypothetical protein